MPWCPKCKCEYRDGFTVCTDCGSPLVEDTKTKSKILLCTFDKEETAEKFISYLNYSKIQCESQKVSTSEQDFNYEVYIDDDKKHDALAAMKAFVKVEDNLFAKQNIDSTYFISSVEELVEALNEEIDKYEYDDEHSLIEKSENNESDTDSEETDEYRNSSRYFTPQNSVIYESKSSKAEESYGSGIMLICVGIIGIVARLYLMKGNFTLDFSTVFIIILFLAMIIYGIVSIKDSKKYRKEAEAENDFITSVQKWLSENISKADLIAQDIPGESDEINYFRRTAYIKKTISDNFPDLDDNFADTMVEEFYESVFDE